MSLERARILECLHIPQADHLIVASRGQRLAVSRQGDSLNEAIVSPELLDDSSTHQIPHTDVATLATGRYNGPVGGDDTWQFLPG